MDELEKDQQPRTSTGILGALYKSILVSLHITPSKFTYLMDRYLSDPSNIIGEVNRVKITNARGNLKGVLLADKMSWKAFCTGIRFLQIPKFEIVIRLHNQNGVVTEHSKVVHLVGTDSAEDEKDE